MTSLIFCLAFIAIPRVVVGQFFNYQPPQYQPQNTYNPGFTNAPNYYTPTYTSHSPGGGGRPSGPELLGNFFSSDGFAPAPTQPANSPLVPYPTQISTLDGSRHHLPYQPVGNSLVQNPTVPSTTTTQFRPSPLIPNPHHHSHIVNGLPQRQFFGNNYEFFRQSHGLEFPTLSPFLGQQQPSPSPTPSAAVSSTSASPQKSSTQASPSASPSSKASEVKAVPSSPAPPTTTTQQSTFLSRFPFGGPSTFASVPRQQQSYNPTTTPAPFQHHFTTPSSTFGVSPSFQYTQNFPENTNELRSPLFESQDESEEGDDDDNSYTLNGNNYFSGPQQQGRQVTQQYKPTAQNTYNALNSQQKDEPAPIRVHTTTPIRIVFNHEQAIQALEETPGVRVVIAHTEKNNLTNLEFTTPRSYGTTGSPVEQSTPRSAASPATYEATSTSRPSSVGTYRPPISTYRSVSTTTPQPAPQRQAPTQRLLYQPVNVPYNQGTNYDQGTTAAALENLALELEGRFANTGRPAVSTQPTYYTETVATTPTPTYEEEEEDPLAAFKRERNGKKYIVIPKDGDKVYRAQEPRVVVNDLANILVQTVQPGGHYSSTPPTTFPRQIYHRPTPTPQQVQQRPTPQQQLQQTVEEEYDQPQTQVVNNEDLSEEIINLRQQLQQGFQQSTYRTTTTTTTTPRPFVQSSPQPRVRPSPTVTPRLLRITTYRPPFTVQSSTYRTTTTPAPPTPFVEEEDEVTVPEVNNQLSSEPPSELTARRQPPRYYYNNKPRDGLSGAHQRYEYNGAEAEAEQNNNAPAPSAPPSPPRTKKLLRRRRPGSKQLVAGSPPRPVQVPVPQGPVSPVVAAEGLLAPGALLANGPAGLAPVPPGAHVAGPVFRVGPRGRLLRRKTRPRAQLQGQQPSAAPSSSAAPPSPSALPALAPVPQAFAPSGPSQFPPLSPYSPSPFLPQEGFPLVTTFRPGPIVQQSLVNPEEVQKEERQNVFRSRFQFQPQQSTTVSTEEDTSSASEEEAPVVPQRTGRRFQTTTSTTEKPQEEQRAVVADRANILQRQIRFNRNRKNQKNQN